MYENKNTLIFGENKNTYEFEDKVSFVDDKKLVDTLQRENIKNEDSTFKIVSLENLPISDVIQIKVNVQDTGVLLINFNKDNFDEEKRTEMIEKIKELKDDVEPTHDTQLAKVKKVIQIANDYHPIYIAFTNKKEIKIPFAELENEKVNMPVLYLEKAPSKWFGSKKLNSENNQENTGKTGKNRLYFKLFDFDYLFISIFTALFSFGFYTALFQIMNKENVGIFLFVMAAVFMGITFYSVYETIFHKCVEKDKWLKLYIVIFLVVGIAVGIIAGYLVSRFAIKTEIEGFSFKNINLITIGASILMAGLSIPFIYPINKIVKKFKTSKKRCDN